MAKIGDLELPGRKESGGGGMVEAVFWVEGKGTQWRVRGQAWILGSDIDDGEGAWARQAVDLWMRRVKKQDGDGEGDEEWSWKREITAHFGNLSPMMRGSFRNPEPGRSKALLVEGEGLGLGQDVEDLEDAVAKRNFRVVVIVPHEVDLVDLSDMKNPKRWLFVLRKDSSAAQIPGGEMIGEWEKVEVWP